MMENDAKLNSWATTLRKEGRSQVLEFLRGNVGELP